jgi:hypothetical protein
MGEYVRYRIPGWFRITEKRMSVIGGLRVLRMSGIGGLTV